MARFTTRASLESLNHEITIIGGGLTGLSLAIALRRHGIPVLLHEAGSYPRHRVCGEFISGVSRQTLDNLGITAVLSDALVHQSVCWFSGDQKVRRTVIKTPALAISRFLLDQRLYEMAIANGVAIHTQSRQSIEADATGMVRANGRIPAPGSWIGIKAHIKGIAPSASLEMHSGPIGYLGITQVEEGWFNACGLFHIDRSIKARREELLCAYLIKNGNHLLAEQLQSAQWRDDSFSACAGFSLGKQSSNSGSMSLGDSHAIIPPFTGNGMTMAFESAEIALPHLIAYSENRISWEQACYRTDMQLHKHFRKRLTASRFIHPLLFHPASRHLLKHVPIAPILSLLR
jgi:flavin-dependent dehydrogenase